MRLIQIAFNLAKRNNKNLLIFGVFLVLGISLPVFEAHAEVPIIGGLLSGIFEKAIGGVGNLLLFVPTFYLTLIQFVLSLFVMIAGILMNQIMSFSLNIPYIPGDGGNQAITVGWTIMRDLANTLLILILAVIGIGAILGKNIEQLGSRIATFIGVALLINFTPVLTGIIIDISNIATKLFFDSVSGGWRLFVGDTVASFGNLVDFVSLDIAKGINAMVTALVGIFFNIFTIAAFILVSFLLIARIAALWILVILSPIAFIAYILPATKKFFSDWWKNFWQWAIIGIPLGVFLFLSTTVRLYGKKACSSPSYALDITTEIGGIPGASSMVSGSSFLSNMCDSIIQIIALAILFVGFFVTFQLSAAGSGFIMKQAQKAGAWGKSQLNTKNLARVGRISARAGAVVGKKAAGTPLGQRAAGVAGRVPGAGQLRRGVAGARRGVAGAKRGVAKVAGEVLTPEEQAAIQERLRPFGTQKKELSAAFKKFEKEKYSPEKLRQWARTGDVNERQAARMLLAREHPEEFAKDAKNNPGEARAVFRDARRTGNLDGILNKNPQYATDPEFAKEIGKSTAEIVMNLTRKQIDALSKEALESSNVVSALLQNPEFNAGQRGGLGYIQNLLDRGEYDRLQTLNKGLSGAITGDSQEEKLESLEKMAQSPTIPERAKWNIRKTIEMVRNGQANPQLQAMGFFGWRPAERGPYNIQDVPGGPEELERIRQKRWREQAERMPRDKGRFAPQRSPAPETEEDEGVPPASEKERKELEEILRGQAKQAPQGEGGGPTQQGGKPPTPPVEEDEEVPPAPEEDEDELRDILRRQGNK